MPSSNDWKRHRARIRALLREKPLPTVIEEMRAYGFHATPTQYQRVLSDWEARKNLSKEDWPIAIAAYDKAVIDYGEGNVRLLIAGRPVVAAKITRNRTRYPGEPSTAASHEATRLPLGVTLEHRVGQSSWIPSDATVSRDESAAEDSDDETTQDATLPFEDFTDPPEVEDLLIDSAHLGIDVDPTNDIGITEPQPYDSCMFDQTTDLPPFGLCPTILDTTENAYGPFPPEGAPDYVAPWQLVSQPWEGSSVLNGSTSDALLSNQLQIVASRWRSPSFSFMDAGVSPILNLPFTHLVEAFKRNGVDLNRITSSGSVRSSLVTLYLQQRFFIQFVDHFAIGGSCLLNSSLANEYANECARTEILQPLFTLLPGDPIDESNLDQLDSKLLRLLLFLFCNNFPACKFKSSSLLAFLARYADLARLLSRLKGINGGLSYQKSLATSLFKASVEAGELSVVQQLLKSKLFGVDSVMFGYVGNHKTALRKAVELRNLDLIRLLLEAQANPNAWTGNHDGALSVFLHYSQGSVLHLSDKECFVSTAPRIVDCLVHHGARIGIQELTTALSGMCSELAYKLIRDQVKQDHTRFNSVLGYLAWYWERGRSGSAQAFMALEAIYQICHSDHDGKCLGKLTKKEVVAVENGDQEYFARQRLSYTCFWDPLPSLVDQIQHAFTSGNVEEARVLLQQCLPGTLDHRIFSALKKAPAEIYYAIVPIMVQRFKDCPGPVQVDERIIKAAVRHRDVLLLNTILDSYYLYDSYRSREGNPWLPRLIKLGDYDCIRKAHQIFPFTLPISRKIGKSLANCGRDMRHFLLKERIIGRPALTRCLLVAVERENVELIDELMKLGADAGDYELWQSGDIATLPPEILQRFLRAPKPATLLLSPDLQLKLLQGCIDQERSLEALQALDKSGRVDIHTRRLYGADFSSAYELPLAMAIRRWTYNPTTSLAAVEFLLIAGSDPDQVVIEGKDGWWPSNTPLLQAIDRKSLELVEMLIKYKADVNRETDYGVLRTPLQKATEIGRLDIIMLLLHHNANINAPAAIRRGGTALQFAAISGNCNIASMLLEKGADLYQPPSRYHGRWPLEGAAEHGRMDMIALLWAEAARRKGFTDEICKRAMELAMEEGHDYCKEFIEELMGPRRVASLQE